MQLLTKTLAKTLPALESTKHTKDPLVRVKFVAPWSFWTWYVIAFDGKDTLFGWIDRGEEKELGYFSLAELENTEFWGMKVERDKQFIPCRLSEITAGNVS